MNLLIIGGLLLLAVIAILGAVFLSRGGDNTSSTPSVARARRQQSAPELASTPVREADELRSPAISRPTIPLNRGTGTLSTGTLNRETAHTHTPREEEQRLPALNGQFHEMADEIRTLHEQAWQLEQRLSILTDMVDHIERSQNNHVNVEEEAPTQSNIAHP